MEDDEFLIYERKYEDETFYIVLNNTHNKIFDINLISDNIKLKDIQTNEIYDASNNKFKLKKLAYKILKKEKT